MKMTTPELEGPRFKVLNLKTLKDSCEKAFGWKPRARQLQTAHTEVLKKLEEEEHDLPYVCGKCQSPIDGDIEVCWACGVVLDDTEDPQIDAEELQKRAKKVGVQVDGRDRNEVVEEVERKEKERRDKTRQSDLSGIEADQINEKLAEHLPDGWTKKRNGQYTTYYDNNLVRRFAVFRRGLNVHFSVDDGFLDEIDGLEFHDAVERKRRHLGRSNYFYVGEIAKDVIAICLRVMRRYSG